MIPTRALRDCLDGAIPGVVSTCAPDGTPNIAYMSQGQYVDGEHLALSYQFFNLTRQNILANPRPTLGLNHPQPPQHDLHPRLQRHQPHLRPRLQSRRPRLHESLQHHHGPMHPEVPLTA